MAQPTYAQLSDPTQGGPGFTPESYPQRLLTVAAMLASGQNPDGTTITAIGVPGFGVATATASPLASGATPTVTITQSGPNTAIVFNFAFGLPAGPQGATGPTGPQGATGPQGPQGPAGPASSPLGILNPGRVNGPASNVDMVALSNVVTISYTATSGRWYRATANIWGTQITTTGNVQAELNDTLAGVATLFYYWAALGPGQIGQATGSQVWQAPSTGASQIQLKASDSAGAFHIVANSCSLAIEDIGSGV